MFMAFVLCGQGYKIVDTYMPFLFCNANEQASKLRKFKTRRTHLPNTRATSIAKDYAAKWMFCIWKSNVSGRGLLTLDNLKMSDPLTVAVERDNLSKLQVLEIRYLGFQGFEGVKYTDCSGQCPTHPLSWSLLQKYHQASLTVLFSAGVKWIDCFRWHTTNRLRFFCAGKGQGGMAYLPRKTESGWVQLFGRWI